MDKDRAIARIDKVALFFFFVLAFFLPIANAAIESCFGFIFLCFLAKSFLKGFSLEKLKEFFKDRLNLAVFVFYVLIGLSMFVSSSFSKSFDAWFFKWGEGVLLFYFARFFLKKRQVAIFLAIFLASGFLISLDGVYQRFTGVDFIRGFELAVMNSYTAVTASFRHYNDLGSFLVVFFFISFGFLSSAKKFLPRIGLGLLSILILVNLFFTYSRGAWFSFLLVCFLALIFYPSRKTGTFFIPAVIVFLLIIAGIPSLRERLLFTFQRGGDSDRFKLWNVAFMMFKDAPLLGQGLGIFGDSTFKYSVACYGRGLYPQYAHNCYFQILAETGLVGLFSFLAMLTEIVRRVHIKLKKEFDPLLLGLFLALLAFLTNAFFDTQLFSLKTSILFWLLLAFLAINSPKAPSREL